MILTKAYLREISSQRNLRFDSQQQTVLNENQRIFKSNTIYDLFISHSSLDKDLVISLVDLFNKCNYSVYVDWINDPQLDRSQVNKYTANTLRSRMNSCKGLAYIATSNSSNSKWCPWELGYEDGKTGRCAILPVLDTSYAFKGQEYLGLYPYLDYDKNTNSSRDDFWVNDPDDPSYYINLYSWLNGSNPI